MPRLDIRTTRADRASRQTSVPQSRDPDRRQRAACRGSPLDSRDHDTVFTETHRNT